MGFWSGFNIRAGEDAHEKNLLDIQQKIEKHKSFMEHLNKVAEDPSYLPEAQQAARQRWIEASQQGPMKFKNYDISDVLTVKSPKVSSYPAPPQEEGGAVDVTNPQFYSPKQLPGEPTITRSGKWSPFEQSAMDAEQNALKQRRMYEETIKYRKELLKPSADPVDSRINIKGEDGQWYQQVTHRSGKQARYGPIPPNMKPGDVEYDPDTQQWVRTVFNPQQGTYSEAETPGDPQIPGVTWKPLGQDPQGVWWEQATDQKGNVQGYRRVAPSMAQAGTTTTREQMVRGGGEVYRQDMTTTRTPNSNAVLPFTPQQPQPATAAAPTIPPPPPTAPPVPGQPAVPQSGVAQPAPAQAAPMGKPSPAQLSTSPVGMPPQKAVVNRDVKSQMPSVPPQKPITPTTPVDVKNVGASMRSDFEPTRTPPATMGGGQKYSKRMNVIKVTAGPLTRFQRDKLTENKVTLRQTVDRAEGVLQRIGMLDNLLTAGKLEIALDPSRPYQLITRTVGRLTPEEASLAADFTSLKEDIQKMRTPMGGAGFRSLEAFLALQAQRGSMLGSPEVTRNVLRNSLRVFLSLHATADHTLLSDEGRPMNSDDSMENLYLEAYGKDVKAAARAMKLDGYVD